jgi:transcriptional regulator with XRE-family HTH domain
MTFGHKLKSFRGSRVVSQKELAALLQMDTAYLSRMESDTPNHLPGIITISRISKALKLNTQEADELYVLAKKLPPDVEQKLLAKPSLLDKVRKLR